MMFGIPGFGDKVQVRLFEEVETVDTQYNIVDFGLQYKGDDGEAQIDSLAVGGSFHSAKKLFNNLDEKSEAAQADKKELEELRAAKLATPATSEPSPTTETELSPA